jgi:PPOX class probable F420-dependent enzyme
MRRKPEAAQAASRGGCEYRRRIVLRHPPELTVPLAAIGNPRYIALRTFRKTGVAVDTPVWAAADDGRLYVWTSLDAGKVKRIRNNPLVEVCACDMRGRPKGEWVPAQASIAASPEEVVAGEARIARKYGWQFKLTRLTSRNTANDTMIEIRDRA